MKRNEKKLQEMTINYGERLEIARNTKKWQEIIRNDNKWQ